MVGSGNLDYINPSDCNLDSHADLPDLHQNRTDTVASSLNSVVPYLASTLNQNISLAVFICSFAWMFVLSTVISNLIFGKQRRIFIQFLIGLALTLTASALFEAARMLGWDLSNPKTLLANRYAQVFNSALFSALFLSLPFVFMIAMDLRTMIAPRK